MATAVDRSTSMVRDWGTGKVNEQRGPTNQKVSKHPTWHYTGQPVDQFYELTQLKRSNVRSNDQLLPEAHKSDMGAIAINKRFPAEHPYSSHIPRRAIFPTFISSEDSKRGLAVKASQLMNSEMPANVPDVTIVSKTKGFGIRHEIQANPRASSKTPLHWLGEEGFDQVPKNTGERTHYYPTPVKTLAPNLQQRPAEQTLSERSADTLRNVERHQWLTSYDLDHTGLGSSDTVPLDNYDAKKAIAANSRTVCDDKLYPMTSKAFIPPRQYEGRQSRSPWPGTRALNPLPPDGPHIRKLTPREVSDEILVNGKPYANLPENLEIFSDNEHSMDVDKHLRDGDDGKREKEKSQVLTGEGKKTLTYLDKMNEQRDDKAQQIEAHNRWRKLELASPSHDMEQLKWKYEHLHTKEHPETFYEHEGRYNEERAGLYKTSYDPSRLAHSMNMLDGSAVTSSKINKSLMPTHYAHWSDEEQSYSGNANSNVFRTLNNLKETQKHILQPQYETSSRNVQEGGFIPTESTKCNAYDTPKFLQTNMLPDKETVTPCAMMSRENQNLNNVRLVSTKAGEHPLKKSVTFCDKIKVVSDPARAREIGKLNLNEPRKSGTNQCNKENISAEDSKDRVWPCKTHAKRPVTPHCPGRTDYFSSLSSNFAPSGIKNAPLAETAYQKQFPAYTQDSVYDDPRFSWQPGHGYPRPQTTLLIQQATFDKSLINRTFHEVFNEKNPDLRDNINQGKKHSFCGLNAQDIRG